MNKIRVEDIIDSEFTININDVLSIDLSNNKYSNIKFIINENSKLYIEDISDDINDRNYIFMLKDNAYLEVNKFYKVNNINEFVNVNLDGINSEVKYNFSTILSTNQNYVIDIIHNNKDTKSNIINHGVVLNNSKLVIEVNGTVRKGCINSLMDQDSKIILYGENNSVIKPNLYIDEYLVEARHGATIGTFNKEQVFYLKSRGISEEECNKLLIRGFLLNSLNIDSKKEIIF